MDRNEIVNFLGRIDAHVTDQLQHLVGDRKFGLNIFGKSALLLAGLQDSIGTVDIDLLRIESHPPVVADGEVMSQLEKEFGRAKQQLNGYYLEFVKESIVFLPTDAEWIPDTKTFAGISVRYLENHWNIASKLFSAHSNPPRKKDKQDIIAAIDQKLVNFQRVLNFADRIFDYYQMDGRNSRFSAVYVYITDVLMPKYGPAKLDYRIDDTH